MNLNEYQKKATATAVYPNQGNNLPYVTLGLVGEAGELANRVKKILRGDFDLSNIEKKMELRSELGDILWYIAQVATELGVNLDDVAKNNLSKLSTRMANNTIKGDGEGTRKKVNGISMGGD